MHRTPLAQDTMRSSRSLQLSGFHSASSSPGDRCATLLTTAAWTTSLACIPIAFAAWWWSSVGLFAVFVSQIAVVALLLRARRSVARCIHDLIALADIDPATGCLNRRGFAHAVDAALMVAARTHGEIAMLALDLDHFKDINDRYGHNIGDAVLYEVSMTLVEGVGSEGVVARMGGEEFSVLLPGADAEAAGVMAERLLQRVRTHRLASVTSPAVVTMSVGIAAERVSSLRMGAALRARADEALYKAKREGRDRVLLWAPGVHSNATPAAAAAPIVRTARWSANNMQT
jgi:diguanylate cyclase (GGDEF)-like protein